MINNKNENKYAKNYKIYRYVFLMSGSPLMEMLGFHQNLAVSDTYIYSLPQHDIMGLANIKLITTGYFYIVKGINTMIVCGCRTQPFLMMVIQDIHKQERGMLILNLHGSHWQLIVSRNNSGHLCCGYDKD